MERTPTTRKRVVKALSDPKPQFVSLVSGGANQVPFRAVKAEEVQPAAKGINDMATPEHDIVKLVFDGAQFATQQSVKTWLTAGGYGECVIKEDGANFVVTQSGDASSALPTRVIKSVMGVDIYVAVEEAAAPVEAPVSEPALAAIEVAKSDSVTLTQKFNSWMSAYMGASTLEDALESGFDGVPPGFREVADCFQNTLGYLITKGKPEGIPALCTELSDLLVKLVAIFPVPDDEMAEKAAKADDGGMTMQMLRGILADMVVDAFKMGNATLPMPLSGQPEGTIDMVTMVNAQTQPVRETQMDGTSPGTVALPAGQLTNVPPHGTVPGATPTLPAGQQINAPEHGTVPGVAPALPAGQTIDAPQHGTATGGELPVGDKKNAPEHGTATGGSLPQGQTADAQAHGTTKTNEAKGEEGNVSALLTALGGISAAMTALTEEVTALKADHALMKEGVISTVSLGMRQTRKGADVESDAHATHTPSVKDVEARKTADFMDNLHREGILGLRRRS